MSDNNRETERGNIESRRNWQGFGNLLDDPFRALNPVNWGSLLGLNIAKRADGYEIEMPVPGFKPDDLDVSYQDGVITVTGRNETRNFTRSLSAPGDLDEESIEANVEHGMLTLKMRVSPKKTARHITIGSRYGIIDRSNQTEKVGR